MLKAQLLEREPDLDFAALKISVYHVHFTMYSQVSF